VVPFLTDDWVAALDDAARASDAPVPLAEALHGLVIGYAVDGFAYHLVFGADGIRARAGAAEHPTVTFRCDRPTATAIARGESNAQRAFMSGKLRIGGDASALLRAHGAIAALPDLFAALRPTTDYGGDDGA
jgi:putative sterol carrier protein